jgi:alkyl hydroperoxide reductase subunit AhpF
MLNAQTASEIRKRFEALRDPVRLVVFSQSLSAPELCAQNEALMRDLAALDDRLSVEVLNPAIDRERAEAYGISAVPATVVEGARDYGIRFLGVPGGYEFSAFLDAVLVASTGEPALSPETRQALAGLGQDTEIKVFSTPT